MKKFLFLLVLLHSAFAEDIFLDYYKNHGINGIEPMFDMALTQHEYWKDVTKKEDISLGYIEKYDSVLVCDKTSSTLSLYQRDPNDKWKKITTYNAFTGKNKGDKQNEGDLKTPVGIYQLVKKLSKVDSFYGPMAFVTSYPNLYDRYLGKDGHGIWIHGLPLNQERDEYTKGCIAIDNKNLYCLDKDINLDSSVLIIYEDFHSHQPIEKQTYNAILAQLYKWLYAWKYNQFDDYIAFYDKDFKRYDGKNYEEFKRYKKRIFGKNENKTINFTKINIIPYPGHPGVFQITFFEKYKSDSFRFAGNKELLVKYNNGKISIFSEK